MLSSSSFSSSFRLRRQHFTTTKIRLLHATVPRRDGQTEASVVPIRHVKFKSSRVEASGAKTSARMHEPPGLWRMNQSGLKKFVRKESRATSSSGEAVGLWYTRAHARWLRDACTCPRCIDQSTSQRLFQTCDIPLNLKAELVKQDDKSITVTWENDIAGYDDQHVSTFSKSLLEDYIGRTDIRGLDGFGNKSQTGQNKPKFWDGEMMRQNIKFVEYSEYMYQDFGFYEAMTELQKYGLVFLKNVPLGSNAVERIAERIGHLRETFYGRTWDVKSVRGAKNVAYTNQFLGFHMDLLYMADPPGFQFLHSLRSSSEGGASMFVDSYRAARQFQTNEGPEYDLQALTDYQQVFHYDNAGVHYRYSRPIIELHDEEGITDIKSVNWSPPFQGIGKGSNLERKSSIPFERYLRAAKKFGGIIEDPANIYEYRMNAGDCVIFNNRRVLHARREFDTTSGERWLKGAYLSTDEFNSRCRVLTREWIVQTERDWQRKLDQKEALRKSRGHIESLMGGEGARAVEESIDANENLFSADMWMQNNWEERQKEGEEEEMEEEEEEEEDEEDEEDENDKGQGGKDEHTKQP